MHSEGDPPAPVGPFLYLHGRGDRPSSPPGDQVCNLLGASVESPHLTTEWLARPFGEQADAVDRWMDPPRTLAIGHSWGAYLLLAAALQRTSRGVNVPQLLLLSAVLGTGGVQGAGKPSLGFIAPRAREIQRALGLDGESPDPILPRDRLSFIHGESDEQCPVDHLHALAASGYDVTIVPGGHRLDAPEAMFTVRNSLGRYATQPRSGLQR